MSNFLKNESSPYLLQHADNPVNWYPWGAEAFERAAREDKPIFLSIGYSTCHWCHVMAHESFEDGETAALLNENFISIKVDREERPDIDSVYMTVCQAMTGRGGWPASIFMTPQQKPFYAGTYFPARPQYGMIGFRDLLRILADSWAHHREQLLSSADKILALLQVQEEKGSGIAPALIEKAVGLFSRSFDAKYGGFGTAPKFPTPHNLLFLLAYARIKAYPQALQMVETTLTQMRKGGLFDQIGYGFSRYSTDRLFLVPHFEKMLYDNALLTAAYAAAYAVTGSPGYLDTAEKTAAYLLREMAAPQGGFYTAQDADSDGVEGKYYLFGYEEILSVLGEETGRAFNACYGITPQGNFEEKSIPNRLHAAGEEEEKRFSPVLPVLYEYRKKRERLSLDDKILTAWNALTIAALTLLFRTTGKKQYLSAAMAAQNFLDENLTEGDRLFVSWRGGKRGGPGFLEDYAFSACARLGLYEATGDKTHLRRAEQLCRTVIRKFGDQEAGGFFLIGEDGAPLVLAPKETHDGAMPCGNSAMAYNLVRLTQLSDAGEWGPPAERQLAFLSGQAAEDPTAHGLFLLALLLHENPPPKITVVPAPVAEKGEGAPLPLYADITVLPAPDGEHPLLNGKTTYYVCERQTCLPPSNRLELWKSR